MKNQIYILILAGIATGLMAQEQHAPADGTSDGPRLSRDKDKENQVANSLSGEKQAKLENTISNFMSASKVPGISAAVVQDGEVVWSAGFGMADLENSVPATSKTLYRLGSISKSITATAAMELWEQGKLDLDSPVQKYCPAFPQKPWPITTRELLGHLAGVRYYNVPETPYSESQSDPEVGNTRHFENGIEAGMRFFANDPLLAQPGTHFNYSTQGYTLVGCAIEGASGEKYADCSSRACFGSGGHAANASR